MFCAGTKQSAPLIQSCIDNRQHGKLLPAPGIGKYGYMGKYCYMDEYVN